MSKIPSMSLEQEITFCPPTTFGELLDREFHGDVGKRLGKVPVHVIKIADDESRYLTLVDFPLKEDELGLMLHLVSPYGSRKGPDDYSRSGIYADWKMPDIQGPGCQRLLRLHKAAFPVECPEFEQDRKVFLSSLEGKDVILFPTITWRKGQDGIRKYDLVSISPELFEICRQRLSFGHKFQVMFLTASVSRTFNPNLGLITAGYLQSEIFTTWEERAKLPLDLNEDYDGHYKQFITGAQIPLWVLTKKDEILAGKLFDVMEGYAANSNGRTR